MEDSKKPQIGFIGQGYVGKNYADNYEARGFEVIRYSKEKSYQANKDLISDCDIVFIAVPTPTTPEGFNSSIVREVMSLVPEGKIAVIKSTVLPGTTESIQRENPEIFVLHSPEFLSESTARQDVDNPVANIIGTSLRHERYLAKAEMVMRTLPEASTKIICSARESEFIKYAHNVFFYKKVVFINLLYDLAGKIGCDWQPVRRAMASHPWIGAMHLDPVHKGGRGAGGNCFIKDFAAFSRFYKEEMPDQLGSKILEAIEQKNIELLVSTAKSLDLLKEIYGRDFSFKS